MINDLEFLYKKCTELKHNNENFIEELQTPFTFEEYIPDSQYQEFPKNNKNKVLIGYYAKEQTTLHFEEYSTTLFRNEFRYALNKIYIIPIIKKISLKADNNFYLIFSKFDFSKFCFIGLNRNEIFTFGDCSKRDNMVMLKNIDKYKIKVIKEYINELFIPELANIVISFLFNI